MDLKQFDTTLKSALENLEVPFDASTWAALESRLEALPAPDAVDNALRPALERIETSYDAGSWSALAHKLDYNVRVRRLRLTKLLEAAILLLLLINLNGFFAVVEAVTKPVPTNKEVPEPIAKIRPSNSKKQHTTPTGVDRSTVADADQNFAEQVVSFVQHLAATLTQDVENKGVEMVDINPQPLADNTSLLEAANFYSQSGLVKFPIDLSLPIRPTESVLFASALISIPGIEISKTVKPTRMYAGTFGSYDKNYLQEAGYSDKKTGYGGGFALGYRKGKWGVESGIQYSQKHYQPKPENVTYKNDLNGISFYQIDQVDADVFSIPVKVTRRVAKIGKTTAHALAGVTANFAASKKYEYNVEHKPPSQVSGPPAAVTPLPNGKGLLENGGQAHNTYATADLGLRVEQPLGKRYIAFVEPIYRKSLGGGLGPNSTRLSTFSIQAGVMASL